MIYLDHAATTACAPEVIEAMLPFFRDAFANAASVDHLPGARARRAVDDARDAVAMLVGARAEDVIFTSGSTEANNLALSFKGTVLTTRIEHPSVLDPFSARAREDDAFIEIDSAGRVLVDDLRARLREKAGALVSVIATNNETGVEQDVASLAATITSGNAVLHVDATQAIGTRRIDLRKTDGLAGASISAHKIHGPKGVGALVATSSLRRAMTPVLRGGGHERGFRSGTLNVPGIVGFGVAARLAATLPAERRRSLTALRARFLDRLSQALPGRVSETIPDGSVSPHVLSIRLQGTNGRALLRAVRNDVAFSLGSACATNKSEPSHVLLALGLDKHAVAETIRISFAADQAVEEVERAAAFLAEAARSLANFSLSA
jgi:cysteine desulfurase